MKKAAFALLIISALAVAACAGGNQAEDSARKAVLDSLAGKLRYAKMLREAPLAIGYPAENPAPKDKWKPEKIHWNKF